MIEQTTRDVNGTGESQSRLGGFALIARGLPQHGVVGFGRPGTPADVTRGCHSHAEAWIDLILMAAYAPRTFQTGGLSVTLERGDLVASERFLADRWNWTYKAVRCFVTKLRAQQMLKRGATKGAGRGAAIAVLSICNYDDFQMQCQAEGRSNGRSKGRSNDDFGAQRQRSINKINNNPPIVPPGGDEAETADLQLSLDEASVAQLETSTTKKRPSMASETIDAGFEAWARVAKDFSLPACRSVSDKRRRAMAARIKAAGSVEAFEAVLRREVAASPFLRGKRPPQPGRPAFIAHVDFVLQQASWDKLVDGFYSGKRSGGARPQEPSAPSGPAAPQATAPTTPQERAAAERGMTLEAFQAMVDKARADGRVRKTQTTDSKFRIDLIGKNSDDIFGFGGRHEDA